MAHDTSTPPTAELIRRACLLEVTARKPGNVHPGASFDDLNYDDFVHSAEASSGWLARAGELGVGTAVLRAIEATRRVTATNTNLGIALLIAPLAAVPRDTPLRAGIEDVLERLTVSDAAAVYRAIRLAAAGGLGNVADQDVASRPTVTLREAMGLAADRDRIARQYVTGFADVLDFGTQTLLDWTRRVGDDWESAVIGLHLSLLAEWPDSLIVRKCGPDVAKQCSERAREVLQTGWPETADGREALTGFDQWLRVDGHRRNPGTTADLVAAILFAALRDNTWTAA
jgi:triphosphoribosyl-dephospho-CoA synthase